MNGTAYRLAQKILHEKREATETHIEHLRLEGKQGIRYTAMIPDIPFLVLGLLSDVGWILHLIVGILYFCGNGFHNMLDDMALAALVGILFGVSSLIYLNKIHEKGIATKLQKGREKISQPFNIAHLYRLSVLNQQLNIQEYLGFSVIIFFFSSGKVCTAFSKKPRSHTITL